MNAFKFEMDVPFDGKIVLPKNLFNKHIEFVALESNDEIIINESTNDVWCEKKENEEFLKMQTTSSFYKDVIGSKEEDVWNDLEPYPNVSQEI